MASETQPNRAKTPSQTEIRTDRDRRREQRTLWRLAAWGTGAALGLIVVAVVSQTQTGSHRLRMALAGTHGPDDAVKLAAAERRADEAQAETRRLATKLRVLSTDRDHLSARLASLEHRMSDVTGSINRQIAAAKASRPPPVLARPFTDPLVMPASQASVGHWPDAPEQAETAKPVLSAKKPAAVAPQDAARASASMSETRLPSSPAAGPPVMVAPLPAPSGPPMPAAPQVSQAPPTPPVSHPSLEPKVVKTIKVPMPPMHVADLRKSRHHAPSKPQYAVDLGGARSSNFLRAQWAAVKANFGPMFAGLRALIAHDRRAGDHPHYRLRVGPLASNAAAARLCARLGVRHCHPTRFVGVPLAER